MHYQGIRISRKPKQRQTIDFKGIEQILERYYPRNPPCVIYDPELNYTSHDMLADLIREATGRPSRLTSEQLMDQHQTRKIREQMLMHGLGSSSEAWERQLNDEIIYDKSVTHNPIGHDTIRTEVRNKSGEVIETRVEHRSNDEIIYNGQGEPMGYRSDFINGGLN